MKRASDGYPEPRPKSLAKPYAIAIGVAAVGITTIVSLKERTRAHFENTEPQSFHVVTGDCKGTEVRVTGTEVGATRIPAGCKVTMTVSPSR